MGILGFIGEKIDSAITTVKEWVAPEGTAKVSAASAAKPKENIQMVSKETQKAQKNEDTVKIKTKTADSVYKKIEELCAEYKMDMKDVKEAKLFEGILGCSTAELAKKSDKEIEQAIEALKFTLSWQSWVLPWQNRDIEDIKDITLNANKKFVALQTGRGCWSDMFRFSSSIEDRLKKAGYDSVTKENVESYFRSLISDAIATRDNEKIKEAYDEALKTFGDILNDTKDPLHKEALTAAIGELQASKRALAAQLSITSCGNDTKAQQATARGLAGNFRAMTVTKDALGERTSQDDNISISKTAFQYMTEEDSLKALAETKNYNQTLAAKIQNGETLTEEEEYYINSVRCTYYAGSMIGASCNQNYPTPDNVLGQIDTDTADLGIQSEVYSMASAYVDSNQNSLTITSQQFTKTVNNATGGNYTNVITNSNANRITTSKQTSGKQEIVTQNNTKTENKTQCEQQTIMSAVQKEIPTFGIEEPSINQSQSTQDEALQKSQNKRNASNATRVTSPLHQTAAAEQQTPIQKQETSETRQKAIQSGVKAVKQYAKDNNVSTMELAIESLNSGTASSATKKWALGQFEAASNAEQILNFNKITNASSAMAAAGAMDEETRSQINTFRSFYIKEAVENLNENSLT